MADQIDYAALAEQARKSTGGVDYAALAEQARKGTTTTPAVAPAEPDSALKRYAGSILPSMTPSDYWQGPAYVMRHPIDSASLIGGAIASNPVGAIPVVGQLKRAYEKGSEGNYAGAAGELTAAALPLISRGVRVGLGKGLDVAGLGVESAGESQAAKAASGYGVTGELLRGDIKGAIGSAVAPPALRVAGRLMQAGGRAMSGVPNDAGLASALMDASTHPTNPVALNPWENQFLTSISDQLSTNRNLTPGQTAALRNLYFRKLGG